MTKKILTTALLLVATVAINAQQKKGQNPPAIVTSSSNIPISNADLGTFPYFKTLPNFEAIDSTTIEENRTYFYDGKNYFTIDGKVSSQNLNVKDDSKKLPSEFQLVKEFDRVVATLGGKKIYEGQLPDEQLNKFANKDLVSLGSKHQVAPSAFYGVVEYVIKTPEKEVWIQLVPKSIVSKFYTLLVVEKQSQLITTNINKENLLLSDLAKDGKAVVNLVFDLDSSTLLTQSKDELLGIVGIFQAHPDWKIKIEVNNAPVGKPDYILALTERRALAIKDELVSLGVKSASVVAKGLGETKPLVSNDTETGRKTNTRVEISRL